MRLDSLEKLYSFKTDDELLALAVNPESLVDEARCVLSEELRRRNLDVQAVPSGIEGQTANFRNSSLVRCLRTVGTYGLNVAAAIFGTAMIEHSVWSQIGHAHSVPAVESREWLLGPTIAALLGFFVEDNGAGKRRCVLDSAGCISAARSGKGPA